MSVKYTRVVGITKYLSIYRKFQQVVLYRRGTEWDQEWYSEIRHLYHRIAGDKGIRSCVLFDFCLFEKCNRYQKSKL